MESAAHCYDKQLDILILDYLETLATYVKKKFELERQLKECWYNLARSRVCLGSTVRVSELQFDLRDQPSNLMLEVSEDGDILQPVRSTSEAEAERNALKRFGILLPKSLKTAQSAIAPAIRLICEIANLQTKINILMRKFEPLK